MRNGSSIRPGSTVTDQRTPAARIESQEIRAWARENGWPSLANRGKLPAEVREAWEAVHGRPADQGYDDLDGGDISAMDDDDLDETLTEEELLALAGRVGAGDLDVRGHPSPPADDELPPPSSLEEARERVGRDPEARHLRRGRQPKAKADPKPEIKVTKAVRDDITGKLAFWLSIPAEPWLRVDPYCGGVYVDQVDLIAVKMAPLICQSPDLVRWFSKSTTFILWTELGIAVRPVVEAIIAHHVTKRIALDESGEAYVQEGGGVDFSAYSARQPASAAA
jgi:hypothetical protein